MYLCVYVSVLGSSDNNGISNRKMWISSNIKKILWALVKNKFNMNKQFRSNSNHSLCVKQGRGQIHTQKCLVVSLLFYFLGGYLAISSNNLGVDPKAIGNRTLRHSLLRDHVQGPRKKASGGGVPSLG